MDVWIPCCREARAKGAIEGLVGVLLPATGVAHKSKTNYGIVNVALEGGRFSGIKIRHHV